MEDLLKVPSPQWERGMIRFRVASHSVRLGTVRLASTDIKPPTFRLQVPHPRTERVTRATTSVLP